MTSLTWAYIVHAWMLSVLMFKFILRYAWVIFRMQVLERPLASEKLVKLNKRTANEYVRAAMRLKGGTIKVGQFVSARADIMPKELVEILGQLQDRVDPSPYAYVASTLLEQFGAPIEQVFGSFEPEAVAAASFGQVHRATTREGDKVVVKVLHRGIEQSLRIDLAIFSVAIFFFGRLFPRFGLSHVYDEIAKVTFNELDYAREAQSAYRVGQNLRDDKRIRVPRVFFDYCRPRVLCLEDITGLRIDDRSVIERGGHEPREVLAAVIGAFCKQIYVDGFFQSDPHPGNLFYYPRDPKNPDAPMVGIIDFGQAKEMPKAMHDSLRRAMMAVIQRDSDAFLAALVAMGIVENAETHKVRHVVDSLSKQLQGGSVHELMSIDFEALARDVLGALQELDALTLPNDLILYGRTLGLLQGLTFQLDPDLPLFEVTAPYLMAFALGK